MSKTQDKRRAVFLDRDGTLIKPIGFRSALVPDEVELMPGVGPGLVMLKMMKFLLVVVTNQGRIATGELTIEGLKAVNERMQDLICQGGGPQIDAIYWCPHKNDKRRDYSSCVCGKPKSGMIDQACLDLNIDPMESYLIGDDDRDVLAGIHGFIDYIVKLPNEHQGPSKVFRSHGLTAAGSFYEAAKLIALREGYRR